MNVKKLLFNNIISGGGDTPTAALITDSLYTHLDAKDISQNNWHDRMGHYDFTISSPISSSENRFNLSVYTATSTNFTFGSFPFTLEFAVNITEVKNGGILFSNTKNINLFTISYRGNGYYGIYSWYMTPASINNGIPVSSVNDGTLHIMDFVFVSSNELITYLDGVKQADVKTNTFSNSMLGLVGYNIGTESSARIIGYVYSFRFYKKALNEYEVRCNCLYEATQGRNSVVSDTEQSYFLEKWN